MLKKSFAINFTGDILGLKRNVIMIGRKPKVVVIGGSYVEMAVRCNVFPGPGETTPGSELSITVTGPGPNQAAQTALCECDVNLVSKIGGDPLAEMIKNKLALYNVNTEFVITAEAKNTGAVLTLVNAEGENAMCMYSGANSALTTKDIEFAEQIISRSDICLIHGRLPQQAIVTAIKIAKIHGKKVVLNPAKPIETDGDESSTLPIEYFNADILIANLYEAAQIAEQAQVNIRTAKLIGSDLIARGANVAIITMGKRGCMAVDRNGADHIPAFEVELADQNARGDAFAGALAAYAAVKDNVKEAAKFASAAGALACTKFGSMEALPSKADIIQLLQQQDTTE